MTVEEVVAHLDALERAALRLLRELQEVRHEFVESLDKQDGSVVDS